jgi:short-subunit dehydrogenase
MSANPTRPLALVTGASSGIGLELAKQFAANGFDVFLTAEDAELDFAVAQVKGLGAGVESAQVDLAAPGGVDELHAKVKATGRPLAAVALNAGRGAGGVFAGGPDGTRLEDELEIIDLNCRSTVHLAKYVVADMVARDEGRLLFTSSIASTMPGSYQAVYNASKSFVQSFAVALREELSDAESSVTVTSLMPGPVETEFFERAEMLDTKMGASKKDDPTDVAREGFEAMMNGEERVISSSLAAKAQGIGGRLVPDSVKAKLHGNLAEPGSAD